MKTKILNALQVISGLIFIASIINAIIWIIIDLNFWWCILTLATGLLTVTIGIKWVKHVEKNPNKAIKNLTQNKDE